MKKIMMYVICFTMLLGTVASLTSCSTSGEVIYFFNWQEFIDPDVLDMFKEETGITVIMDPFESNESMYAKVSMSGGYDVICPSDYMVERMINEGLLHKLDFSNIPNYQHIDENLKNMPFDPTNEYYVPYMWGTLGIIYDTTRILDPVTSWDSLWDERYAGDIFMYDSIRDALSVALARLGYSLNTQNMDELDEAVETLIEQLPLVQAYLGEPVKDKMIGGEGILAVMYSGDALYCMFINEDLDYVVPIEGSNIWVDGFAIPANAPNKEGAEKFIDFMSRPEIAAMNAEYIGYTTANKTALDLIAPELRDNHVFWPTQEEIDRCEYHADLGELRSVYADAFSRVMIGR